MANLDSILKNRDITLPTKAHLVKALVFPVVMYGCEGWTMKKAEHWRNDAFELWCWRKFWRVPWPARRWNQSILKGISPEYSLEGLMLKLKLQYFGHLMWSTDSWRRPWCWERLRAGGEGDDRGWDGWMESLTRWTWVWASSRNWWWTGKPGVLLSMGLERVRWLRDWAELNWGSTQIDSNGNFWGLALLKEKKIILYWGIPDYLISKQCFDNFRWTAPGHSNLYTCIHSPPNSPSIQATTQHWTELHVLNSRSLLVIHFKHSSVYMFIPNSPTISFPPPPAPSSHNFIGELALVFKHF